MTNQEMFNRAWQYHVVEGNPLGYDEETGECSYAKRCAIGCQVGVTLEQAERWDREEWGIARILRKMGWSTGEEFAASLQRAHDRAAFATPDGVDIAGAYMTLARLYSLEVPK